MALREIDIAIFSLIIGWSAVIMYTAGKFAAPPMYIRIVSLSYIIFISGWAYELHTRLHEPVGWRPWLALTAGLFGLGAMFYMTRHYNPEERRRRHNAYTEAAIYRALVEMTPEQRNEFFEQLGHSEDS